MKHTDAFHGILSFQLHMVPIMGYPGISTCCHGDLTEEWGVHYQFLGVSHHHLPKDWMVISGTFSWGNQGDDGLCDTGSKLTIEVIQLDDIFHYNGEIHVCMIYNLYTSNSDFLNQETWGFHMIWPSKIEMFQGDIVRKYINGVDM